MHHKSLLIALAIPIAACGQDGQQPKEDSTLASLTPGSAAETEDANNRAGGNRVAPPVNRTGEAEPPKRWAFTSTASGHRLVYGEPETDNTRILMHCGPGDTVAISFLRGHAPGGPSKITLNSGGATQTVDATVSPSELNGLIIQSSVEQASPVMRRFRGGAPLAVTWGEDRTDLPGAGDSAGRFFDAC